MEGIDEGQLWLGECSERFESLKIQLVLAELNHRLDTQFNSQAIAMKSMLVSLSLGFLPWTFENCIFQHESSTILNIIPAMRVAYRLL